MMVRCSFCSKSLERNRFRINKTEHHFCNRQCYANWKYQQSNSSITLRCDNCGLELNLMPHETKRSKHHFCSMKCSSEWRVRHRIFTGSKNPAWCGGFDDYYGPNWQEQQRKVKERDNYTCQICQATRLNNKNKELSVHHIISFDNFGYVPDQNTNYIQANERSNLITLCMRCHRIIENGISLEQAKLMDLEPLPQEQSPKQGDYECLICHRCFLRQRDVYFHSKRVHSIRKNEYIIKFFGQPVCACGCSKPTQYNIHTKRFPLYINGHNLRGKSHSEATKHKMSEKRKIWWQGQLRDIS